MRVDTIVFSYTIEAAFTIRHHAIACIARAGYNLCEDLDLTLIDGAAARFQRAVLAFLLHAPLSVCHDALGNVVNVDCIRGESAAGVQFGSVIRSSKLVLNQF